MTSPNSIIADLQAENAELRRQRDELLEALEWIASSLPQIGVERAWMLDCANKAISSAKGGTE